MARRGEQSERKKSWEKAHMTTGEEEEGIQTHVRASEAGGREGEGAHKRLSLM